MSRSLSDHQAALLAMLLAGDSGVMEMPHRRGPGIFYMDGAAIGTVRDLRRPMASLPSKTRAINARKAAANRKHKAQRLARRVTRESRK